MTARKTVTLLASVALLLTVCAGVIPSAGKRAHATSAQGDKIAADLKQKLNGTSKVNVVISAAGPWSSTLTNAVSSNGGSVTKSYKNFNARAASLPPAAVNNLANRSDVGYIALDRDVQLLGHVTLTTGADAAAAMANYDPTYDGEGVGIAVLDSGIDPNHVAFTVSSGSASRVVASVDFTGEGRTDDPYGHGTHVASIAAGNGQVSNGAFQGLAPAANIINLRVLNSQGAGSVSSLLSALDWIKTNKAAYNIRVVNMSLGTAAVDSYKYDPLCQAARSLVNSGIVVVAAAGNEGKDASGNKVYGLIHSPGIEPSVITVGAANTFGTDARNDDGVTTYSSRGPTRGFWTDAAGTKHYDNLVKPDLVAPGNKIIDAKAYNNYLVTQNPSLDANVSGSPAREQMYLSGTSMATPVVAGAAALLLQANPGLTPNLVRAILEYTAQPLAGYNQFEQGAGEINLEGAMRLARLVRAGLNSSTPVGAPLLTTNAPPTPQTTIAGYQFTWGQGLIMDYAYATGTNLITKYQGIYGLGTLMGDGTVESNGVLLTDGTLMSDGVVIGDQIVTSNGVVIGDGSVFLSCGVLIGDGVLLTDGTLMSDGVVIGDGVLLSDSVLMGDLAAQASNAMINGDGTASMKAVADPTPPASPSSLTATASSRNQVSLKWADNSANESGFRVERSTDGVTFTQIATVAANTNTYSSNGLGAGRTYYYRVKAYNSAGDSAYSNTAGASTPTR